MLERDLAASVAAWAGEFWGEWMAFGRRNGSDKPWWCVPKTDHNLRATVGTACLYPASASKLTMLRLVLPNATPIR